MNTFAKFGSSILGWVVKTFGPKAHKKGIRLIAVEPYTRDTSVIGELGVFKDYQTANFFKAAQPLFVWEHPLPGERPVEEIERLRALGPKDPRVRYITEAEIRVQFPVTGGNTMMWMKEWGFAYIGINLNGPGSPFKVTHVFFNEE